jgi:PAS domain S-box-containing protein
MGEPTPPRPAGEEHVKTENQHLAAIVRSTSDAILSKDRNAIITSWNEGAVQLYGYTAEEMIGQSVASLIPPGREGEEIDIVERILAGERVENYDTERVCKDGTRISVSLTSSPIHDDAGEIVGVSTTARDRTRAQAEIEGVQQRFLSAFNDAPIGMSLFSVERETFGRPERVNAAMHELLGYSWEELNDLAPLSITHPDDAELERELVEELISGRRDSYELEKRNRHREGHWLWLQINVSLLKDEDPPRFAIAHVMDISKRKEAEVELAEARANLERSNAELDQFAYVASHDLKEPLILLSAYARMLEERHGEGLEEEGRTFLGHIRDEANRMKAMIDDLLDYSRLETRSGEATPVDLNEVLASACRTLEPTLEETGGSIEQPGNLPTVSGSQVQFERLFRNLLSNGIKFRGDAEPLVRVSAEQADGSWRIDVADNGIGIDPAKAERVFDVFQRLHSQERYPGTGMGLAICKRIVERHGGEISVAPRDGGGSTFSFTLPG